MSAAPNKKPSVALGLILILLLLAAVVFGGMWVVQAAFTPRMSDARAAAEASSTPAKEPTVQAEPVVQEPEPQEQPAQQPAEQTTESRVTLMALGDDLIHNCVYWSAQTPEGGYDFTSFFDDIRPTVRQYDLACINQETILVKDRELIESYPVFGSPIEVADALADTGFNVVTFASNHCFDKKETGITDTLSYFHETYPEITTLGIHDTEADAEAISGIHYDLESYADVVDAIHVIQTSMDITGTTAKEAEHTISGSINALQAAGKNLLVGFGNADADMEQLCGNMAEALKNVISNITPVIENIVKALPTETKALFPAFSPNRICPSSRTARRCRSS